MWSGIVLHREGQAWLSVLGKVVLELVQGFGLSICGLGLLLFPLLLHSYHKKKN